MSEDSPLPQQHPAFDLNDMMYAMPTRDVALKDPTSFIHLMPNEVLGEIFEWLRRLPPGRHGDPQHGQPHGQPMPTPMLVSHVCGRWRKVVIEMVSQWTHLEMCSTRCAEVFSDLLSRSRKFVFSLVIWLPALDIQRRPYAQQVEFRETFMALEKNISRLHYLYIRSNNATFCLIFNMLLKNVSFPVLESLVLDQVDPTTRRYHVGPVKFNPAVFHTLRMENIMIDCDASNLAGLRVVHLVNSAGTLLDQTQLTHSTYPLIPTAPAMPQLFDLKVDGTYLFTSPAFTPSFESTSLRSLTLSRIQMSTITADAVDRVDRLLRMTYGNLLENLVLDSLDVPSFKCLVLRMASSLPRYFSVKQLSLAKVEMSIIDRNFMKAFPQVIRLNLIDVNASPILAFLEHPEFMPDLTHIRIDHKVVPRMVRRVSLAPPISGPTAPL
ncbi:hypothetical protein FPV67DRAFT_302858 [Lyophyllum atratum]|nr:hypothetical protein FPV67DRAFT_302858 [Lyophyllum atratum]